MRPGYLLIALLTGAVPAIAQPARAAADTLTTGSVQPAVQPPAHHFRETEAERLLSITPRPPLNIDCTPLRERAARTELEQAQYRLKCGR